MSVTVILITISRDLFICLLVFSQFCLHRCFVCERIQSAAPIEQGWGWVLYRGMWPISALILIKDDGRFNNQQNVLCGFGSLKLSWTESRLNDSTRDGRPFYRAADLELWRPLRLWSMRSSYSGQHLASLQRKNCGTRTRHGDWEKEAWRELMKGKTRDMVKQKLTGLDRGNHYCQWPTTACQQCSIRWRACQTSSHSSTLFRYVGSCREREPERYEIVSKVEREEVY